MQPLLHIGYHKTGTTWLQRHVFPRSDVGFAWVAGPKTLRPTFVSVNPFDFRPDVARRDFEPTIADARARDLVPVLSYERLSGNPHSGGYDSKAIADRLAAAFPGSRVMLVIREQTRMLVSVYKQYITRGGAASFRQYVATPPGEARVPLFRFDFLEYHRLIAYYQHLFGTANLLVLPYELLEKEPHTFLARIGEFAGARVVDVESQRANTSLSASVLSLKRHLNRYFVRDAVNTSPPLPLRGSNKALLDACRKTDVKIPAVLRDEHERRWRRFAEEQVGDRYTKSNALTQKLTGLDLWALGYAC